MKLKHLRRIAKWQRHFQKKSVCPNCGELCTGHFVPPGFGEPGMFICKTKETKP
jgi:ribosomal protein L32